MALTVRYFVQSLASLATLTLLSGGLVLTGCAHAPKDQPIAAEMQGPPPPSQIVAGDQDKKPATVKAGSVAVKNDERASSETPRTDKKSRLAAEKKAKKSAPQPSAEPSPAENAILPDIPLPSKPAAIGGSGG